MRRLALLGLVVSLVLGAIAVAVTNDNMRAQRNEQDRMVQEAVNGETALISDGERQTTTALSLLLVNPAVRGLLSGRTVPLAKRAARSSPTPPSPLAAIQRTAFVPLSAACLDDGTGRQLVCGPTARPVRFPQQLGRQFAALAGSSAVGAASGAFLSPVSNQFSVAFLAPFRARGRLLGLVHLDISIADTRGGSLIVDDTPGRRRPACAPMKRGMLSLNAPSGQGAAGGLGSPAACRSARSTARPRPQFAFQAGHRAMVAALPLTIGGQRQHVAVVATRDRPQSRLLQRVERRHARRAGASRSSRLIGSIVGLVVSNRRIERELSTDPLTGRAQPPRLDGGPAARLPAGERR